MMDDPKPCPFCGADAELQTVKFGFEREARFRVVCTGCGIDTDWGFFDKDEVLKYWNRRVADGNRARDQAKAHA